MDNNTIIDDGIIDETREPNYASRGLRFINFLIDYVIIIVMVVFTSPVLFGNELLNDGLFSNLIIISYYVTYYFGFEFLTGGKTIGKYITGTRAVMVFGEKASVADILKRTFSRLLPFEQFSMFGSNAWHDSIPGMVVIKE